MLTNDRSRQHMATTKNNARTTNQTEGQGHNSSLTKDITGQHKGQTRTLFTFIRKLEPATLTRYNRLNNNRLNITRSLIRTIKVLPNRRGLDNKTYFRQGRNTRKSKIARTKDTLSNNGTSALITLTTMSLHKFTNTIRRNLRGQTDNDRRSVLTNNNNRFNGAKTRRGTTILVARRGAVTLRNSHRAIDNQSH